jgi:hypothetical protein
LINGEKLLDLLIENRIGVKPRAAELYEVDDAFFGGSEDPVELAVEGPPDAGLDTDL